MSRREIVWSLKDEESKLEGLGKVTFRSSDVLLIFTRKGIEVDGYYDFFVGIGPTLLVPWEEVDEYRRKVMSREPLE